MSTVPIPQGATVDNLPGAVASTQTDAAPSGPGYPNPVVPGNIQWYDRPKVPAPKGTKTPEGDVASYGTVHSASREENGLEVLYPQIYDGKWHSDDEAWQHYKQTGEHMGKFKNPADADKFAIQYHNDAAAGKFDSPKRSPDGQVPIPQGAIIGDLTDPDTQQEPAPEMVSQGRDRFGNEIKIPKEDTAASLVGPLAIPATAAGIAYGTAGITSLVEGLQDLFAPTVTKGPQLDDLGNIARDAKGRILPWIEKEGPSLARQGAGKTVEFVKNHYVATAFAYHIARELGIPLPKMLDVLQKFSSQEH